MRKYLLYIIVILLIIPIGCNNSTPVKKIPLPTEEINFSNPIKNMAGFTVSSVGDLYVLEMGSSLARYKHDGTLIQEYKDTADFIALCWGEDILYAYDAVKYQIVSMNIENGEIKTIIENFQVDEVLKLVIIEGSLYALVVPDSHSTFVPYSNGFIDFGEKLYRIDLKTRKLEDTREEKVMAIYGGSDGMLYYYAYRDDSYGLFSYSSENGKSTKLYDMSDIGYISAFVYEGEFFACSVMEEMIVKIAHLSNNIDKDVDDNIIIVSGNDMSFLKGNLLYYGFHKDENHNAIASIFLSEVDFNSQIGSIDNTSGEVIQNKGKITISTALRAYINPNVIKKNSGIGTKIVDQSVYGEVLLTEIMSGNPDVDIYITSSGSYVAEGVRNKGIYVPLNDSKIINSYMDKCFDYVADVMQTPTGDIWMLPISLDSDVIWYVPENIEKYDIQTTDFLYLDSFLDLSTRMPKTGSYAAYVDYAGNFSIDLHTQYDLTYNDYLNKKINFDTPLYKDIFDKSWTGWVNYSPMPRHPLFRDSRDDYNGELLSESSLFDKSKVIYKWSGIGNHITIPDFDNPFEGWRALPTPRISSDVKGNIAQMYCAFVNPHSKNKELAIEYLEAIAEVPFEFSSANTACFLFEDKALYAKQYDITQPGFDDIINIMKDGMLPKTTFYLNGNIVDEYQNGRLSIDEAVAAIQREAEMWMNE